ncbi:MAG: cytochrome C [Gammaproteobacteria bacterium]
MTRQLLLWLLGLFAVSGVLTAAAAATDGDPNRGAHTFRQCAACHSLEPGRHLTGPSLAAVVGRAAGTAPGFTRYSDALAASGLTWDRDTLDRWLAEPAALVPGTSMRIQGVLEIAKRRDLIAYLEAANVEGDTDAQSEPTSGGMMGGVRGPQTLDLKHQTPSQRVTAIRHCGDAYHVTLGTGKTHTFWEFNLRFKTDSSPDGPPPGSPAIARAGMMGDRAFVVFADPAEISAFIRKECPSG